MKRNRTLTLLDFVLLGATVALIAALFWQAPAHAQTPTFTVTLKWTPPTLNTDSTPLTNLAGYRVYYGTSAAIVTAKTNRVDVTSAAAAQFVLTQNQLQANTLYFFGVSAVNALGVESPLSNIAQKATPDTRTPGAPTGVTVDIVFSAGP